MKSVAICISCYYNVFFEPSLDIISVFFFALVLHISYVSRYTNNSQSFDQIDLTAVSTPLFIFCNIILSLNTTPRPSKFWKHFHPCNSFTNLSDLFHRFSPTHQNYFASVHLLSPETHPLLNVITQVPFTFNVSVLYLTTCTIRWPHFEQCHRRVSDDTCISANSCYKFLWTILHPSLPSSLSFATKVCNYNTIPPFFNVAILCIWNSFEVEWFALLSELLLIHFVCQVSQFNFKGLHYKQEATIKDKHRSIQDFLI